MAKAWKDVIASPQYQALAPEQKAQAQEQYFNEVVAPQTPISRQVRARGVSVAKSFATASDQYAHNGGEYHETVLYTRQSGGDVLIIGVYAHRTRYDDVLCGYTNHMYLV